MSASSDKPARGGIDTVAIVGTGLMGRGIAQVVAQAGCEVRLFDAKPGAAEAGRRDIESTLNRLAERGKLDAANASAASARVGAVESLGACAGAQLVIEAIIERLEDKRAVFKSLEDIVSADCILASNTSSLSVTAIAAACRTPQRVAGLHFFSPVPLMKVVEIVDGLLGSPGVGDRLMAFGAALGHTPVRTRDTPGFIVNHAGRGFGTEALRIASEGIADHEVIDRILRSAAGFRMGPFELLDLTGLDVSHPVMESIYHQFYEEPRFRPSPLTGQRMAAGLLGRKTGRGFYAYGDASTIKPQVPATDSGLKATGTRVWLGAAEPLLRRRVADLIDSLGGVVEAAGPARDGSLCLVLPMGRDATTCALDEELDPTHTVALDTLFDLQRHRTLMTTPITSAKARAEAQALFGADGTPVDVIRDSPGFVTQRVVAHIVNIACDIAQQRIATPGDIDLAVRLGLSYPMGPLAWGDALGPARVLGILHELQSFYGDPRYRPSPWLTRRARLGVSLLTPDS